MCLHETLVLGNIVDSLVLLRRFLFPGAPPPFEHNKTVTYLDRIVGRGAYLLVWGALRGKATTCRVTGGILVTVSARGVCHSVCGLPGQPCVRPPPSLSTTPGASGATVITWVTIRELSHAFGLSVAFACLFPVTRTQFGCGTARFPLCLSSRVRELATYPVTSSSDDEATEACWR